MIITGTRRQINYLIEHLSLLLPAGMNIVDALAAIKTDLRSRRLRQLVTQIQTDIEAGATLSLAITRASFFPNHLVALIKIGEESGRLTDYLKVIVETERQQQLFRAKLQAATAYPLIVLCLMVVVGVGTAWFLLPRLADVFGGLNVPLPLITVIFISIGSWLDKFGGIIIPVSFILLLVVIYVFFYAPDTKFIGQGLLLRLPVIGQLLAEIELARFGYILGSLLESGLPIVAAITALTATTKLAPYKKLFSFLITAVSDGNSLAQSFQAYRGLRKLMPTPIQALIATGEQSGSLATTLLQLGKRFAAKTDTTSKNFAAVLEPILLVIIWLGVVTLALAVILPINYLIGQIQP